MSVVRQISQAISAEVLRSNVDLDTAAGRIEARFPSLCSEVMEIIGNYPSSEPELAALQRVWMRSRSS